MATIRGTYLGTEGSQPGDDHPSLYQRAVIVGAGAFWWNHDRSILYVMVPLPRAPEGVAAFRWHIHPSTSPTGDSWI